MAKKIKYIFNDANNDTILSLSNLHKKLKTSGCVEVISSTDADIEFIFFQHWSTKQNGVTVKQHSIALIEKMIPNLAEELLKMGFHNYMKISDFEKSISLENQIKEVLTGKSNLLEFAAKELPNISNELIVAFSKKVKKVSSVNNGTSSFEINGHEVKLTPTELRLLNLVAELKTNKEICEQYLHISPTTLNNKKHLIYKKMDVDNLTKAVLKAHKFGLIEL